MIVNAEYLQLDKQQYRRKTLLQFGKSNYLIGSAVLINPGSSSPIGPASCELIESFYSENHKDENINLETWRQFSPDATMRQLAKLFNGSYLGKERCLNGVIQLFNCFYYKDQNLNRALQNFDAGSEMVFKENHLFKDRPVYFGWGNEGKYGKIKRIAQTIIGSYDINLTPIYNIQFEENCFYHPGYLNRSYKRNLKSIEIIKKLNNLLS